MRVLIVDDITPEQEAFLRESMVAMGLAHRVVVLEEDEPKQEPAPQVIRPSCPMIGELMSIAHAAMGSFDVFTLWPVRVWYGIGEIMGGPRWRAAERRARQALAWFWRLARWQGGPRASESRRLYDWRSSPRWGRERWRSIT